MKLILLLLTLAAVSAFAQQPCQDYVQGCYDTANNIASSNCKSQGGCSSAEWDGWYDDFLDQCLERQNPYCQTDEVIKGKPKKTPVPRKTAAVDFVWRSEQRTQAVLLAMVKH